MRELVEACVSEYMKVYSRLRILGGRLERGGEVPSTCNPTSFLVAVKSVREVSVDEVPILNSLASALSFYDVKVRFHEYDMMAGEEGRYEGFASAVEGAVRGGVGVVAVAPYLMPVAVVSRLPDDVLEVVESSPSLTVTVRYENLLYLPERGRSDEVEIVGKENSASSVERAEWLAKEAERRGIRRVATRFLEDGRAIFNYVTSKGPRGVYKVVPVTKLSSYIVSLARCYGIEGLDEVVREEEARHVIYFIGTPQEVIDRVEEALREELRKPRPAIPREPFTTWIMKGAKRVIGELVRRYGLE